MKNGIETNHNRALNLKREDLKKGIIEYRKLF